MKFLCDRMLVRVGRWLRAAGYDTTVAAADDADPDLVARARDEGRWLLTRDRRLVREDAGDGDPVVLLAADKPSAAAAELRDRLGVDWQATPFTRCMLDNAELVPAGAADLARVPDGVPNGPVMRCPACDRVYWPGSHLRRMHRQLAAWRGNAGGS